MKHTLGKVPSRLHLVIVTLALLGAMWSSIDLHQHQDGLSSQCVTCSLEKPIASGFFIQQAAVLPTMTWQFLIVDNWQAAEALSSYARLPSIRAPPSSSDLTT